MYQNTRRIAAEHVARLKACAGGSPATGSSFRHRMLSSLPLSTRSFLTKFTGEVSLTETFPCFGGHFTYPKDRSCIETDTVPLLTIDAIVAITDEHPVLLPCLPHNAFLYTYPNYATWLYSSVRFPRYDDVARCLLPGDVSVREIVPLDIIDLYLSAICGTEDPMMLSKLYYVLQMKNKEFQHVVPRPLDPLALANLLVKRDSDPAAAIAYRRHITKTLAPEQYYQTLVALSEHDVTLLSRSRFNRLELLLAANLLDPVRCAVEPEFLATLILDRLSTAFTGFRLSDIITDKTEMIQDVLHRLPMRFYSGLKYWIKLCLKCQLLHGDIATFTREYDAAQTRYVDQAGLMDLIHFFAPTIDETLLVEYITVVAARTNRFEMVALRLPGTGALVVDTPKLDAYIMKNIDRLNALKMVSSSTATAVVVPMEEDKKDVKELLDVWAEANKHDIHSDCSKVSNTYNARKWIANLCMDVINVPLLQALYDTGLSPVLNKARVQTLIAWFANDAIRDIMHLGVFPEKVPRWLDRPGRRHLRHLQRDLYVALVKTDATVKFTMKKKKRTSTSSSTTTTEVEEPVDTTVMPAVYLLPYTLLRERFEKLKDQDAPIILDEKGECAICMLKNQKMQVLHGEARHAVCVHCAPVVIEKFHACPFCRAVL